MSWKKEKETFRQDLCSPDFPIVQEALGRLHRLGKAKPNRYDEVFREKDPTLSSLFSTTYRRIGVMPNGVLTLPPWMNSAPHATYVALSALCFLVDVDIVECPLNLKIEDAAFSVLPLEIKALQSLTSLDLQGSSLRGVPKEIGLLSKMRVLKLSGIEDLPESIGDLSSLTELHVTNGCLKSLPSTLGEMRSLAILNASNNQLDSIPDCMGACGSLRKLNLSQNKLISLGDIFSGLHNLTEMDVSGNPLVALPDSFCSLVKLQALNIADTSVSSWPNKAFQNEVFYRFKNGELEFQLQIECSVALKSDLADMQLQSICDLASEGNLKMRRLNRLKMQNRGLVAIPVNIGELKNLEVLDLSQNSIGAIPSSIFELKRLNTLNLSGNQCSTLPMETLEMQYLVHVDISDNRFSSVPEVLGHFPSIKELNLQWNPLQEMPESFFEHPSLKLLTLDESQDDMVMRIRELIPKIMIAWWGISPPER